MFHHTHPYPPYILPTTERLIVGTLPPRVSPPENSIMKMLTFAMAVAMDCWGKCGIEFMIWD